MSQPALLTASSLSALRRRTSEKWREYPDDVLPMFVAETDFDLAPAVRAALETAVANSDTGYVASRTPLPEVFATFAQRRYGWDVDPARIRTTADVSMGIVEILRRVTSPGDRVVITPPVYPPFFDLVPEAGAVVESVPLIGGTDAGWRLELDGIERAFRSGARAILLCHPHNPTGTVHPPEDLAELARIAARHGAAVVSDEIHAPLSQSDAGFRPFLSVSDEARAVGYTVTSASKAFNLAGLKCALMVTAEEATTTLLRALPIEVEWRTGQFGLMAAIAALSEESDVWLDSLLLTLDQNRRLLGDLLAERIPQARYRMPDATYLAWIDLSDLGWGDNPARRILRDGKLALHYGPAFGAGGSGHVRLNFGTSPELIDDAIGRIASLAGD